MRALLDGVRRLGFAGVNVTFPYKESVVPLLDELSPRARAIGAVNTVVVRDGRLIGYNTDTTGFERAIANLVGASNRGPVALIGAGGVGKAIAFALAKLGVTELSIFDTDRAKAEALSSQLQGRLKTRIAEDVAGALQAPSAWSTQHRSACCRTAAWRCRSAATSRSLGGRRGLYAAMDAAADRGKSKGARS